MNYATLKAADAALPGAPLDLADATAALNAQTVTLPPQDIAVSSAMGVLLLSPTGDWLRLEAAAAQAISSLTAPTQADQVTMAAKLALALVSGPVTAIGTSQPSILATWNGFVAALVAGGVLSAATQAALQALVTPTVPLWPVVLTENDVAAARGI
jgi:hypothetical protein